MDNNPHPYYSLKAELHRRLEECYNSGIPAEVRKVRSPTEKIPIHYDGHKFETTIEEIKDRFLFAK